MRAVRVRVGHPGQSPTLIVACRPSVAKVTHFLRSRARLAVSTAASASRLARAPARRPCCQLHRWCTSRPRRSDARPRCALARCDTSASASAWNESRQPVLLQKRARPPPHMPIAVPGAAPVERSAEQPSTTTEDAGALHATRGASTTAPSNCCRGASIQRTESGPKGSLRQTKL